MQYLPSADEGAAADFWRVFGGALILYLVSAAASLNLVDAIIGSLVAGATFCAWASKAPRSTAIGPAAFATLGLVGSFAFAIHDEAWWRLGLAALDGAALLLAVRAIGPARHNCRLASRADA
jgi:hypothetical protein